MIKPSPKLFFILILVFFFPLYLLRLNQVKDLEIPEEKEMKVIGRVSQQPYLKGSQQIVYLGPVLIKTERFPGFFYGQKIEVVGEFEKRVINPFQSQYSTYYPSIRVLKEGEKIGLWGNLRRFLFDIRGYLEKVVSRLLPEPHASLLLGILFGVKRSMPQEFWQKLRETGTLHIVVASGQNVSMVANFLMAILVLVISRKKALALAVLGVILYILMVGADPPVVRAGIMATFAYLASFFGREEEGTMALLLAAMIMLLSSPLILFDVGFQLSFAATAGILWLYPWFKTKRIFSLPFLGEGLATTMAAQLGVMPIILLNFGEVSLLSPLVNALVLWTVPIVMILGVVLVVLGLIFEPLAVVLGWFAWLFLSYFVKVVELFGRLPWGTIKTGSLSFGWALGYYLVLIYFIWLKRRKKAYVRDKMA